MRTDKDVLCWTAQSSLDQVSRADLLLVPGGSGTRRLAGDPGVLSWLRAIDATTQLTASVCTGSLLLAASGLLQGRKATTHWAYLQELGALGALPVAERHRVRPQATTRRWQPRQS